MVSEFDSSGSLINTLHLAAPVTALTVAGGSLFVADDSGTVGQYDATTGAPINASLITGLSPDNYGLAVAGGSLFVANLDSGTIGQYDAATGAPTNASFVTGLSGPTGLAVSGGDLFVTNFYGGTVGQYDATTGAVINASLISGLDSPFGLVVTTPEPSAWVMFAIGATALLGRGLRKQRLQT